MNLKNLPSRFYHYYLSKRWNLSWYASGGLMEDFLYDYKEKLLPYKDIFRIHRKGFSAYDWCYCGIRHTTYKNYLSNVDYIRAHPYNGLYSKWIDDKLTLKHISFGSAFDQYMPKYYYHIDEFGNILCLANCQKCTDQPSVEDIADLLESKGALAIKLLDGCVGAGFYKGEFFNGLYFLNEKSYSKVDFCAQLSTLRNYLITEYFYPHPFFSRFCASTPSCIRYAVCRVNGELKFLASFVRIGTKKSGFTENYGLDGALCLSCPINEQGYFNHGSIFDSTLSQKRTITHHPDTGELLEGHIPFWTDIQQAVNVFCSQFPQLVYLGFDFVITSDSRVKVLEINSLSSLDCIQEERSVFDTPAGDFFRSLRKS